MAKKATAAKKTDKADKPAAEPVIEEAGRSVVFWHDRDTSVPATIIKLDPGDRADIQFETALMINGHNHGLTRQGVRCGHGAKTPGTWSYVDPPLPPPTE